MQLRDIYALLSIAVAATCVTGIEENQRHEIAKRESRKLQKRGAAVILDSYSEDSSYLHNPQIIFKRVSKQRYGRTKPKYGTSRPKHESPKYRNLAKKYRQHYSPKPPSHKKRTQKPRRPLKRPTNKPIYGIPKKPILPHAYYTPEPLGFAEPPVDLDAQQPNSQNYGEPPVDSYGVPLKGPKDTYPTAPSYYENSNSFNHYYEPAQPVRENIDNSFAYTKKRPLFVKPDELFDATGNVEEEIFNGNSYSEYNPTHFKEPTYVLNKKNKPQYFPDSNLRLNKNWKNHKWTMEHAAPEPANDGLLVGGQYAEPPARYVPKFQPSAPMYTGEDDFVPLQKFAESEVPGTSASPYDNYKNSNMAFSPQNLNDVFSIVDK